MSSSRRSLLGVLRAESAMPFFEAWDEWLWGYREGADWGENRRQHWNNFSVPQLSPTLTRSPSSAGEERVQPPVDFLVSWVLKSNCWNKSFRELMTADAEQKSPCIRGCTLVVNRLNLVHRFVLFGLCRSRTSEIALEHWGVHKIPSLWLCLSAHQSHPHAAYPRVATLFHNARESPVAGLCSHV